MKFGSHLYGTNSEFSDTDYKGIYLPSKEDYFLQSVKKTISQNIKVSQGLKNTSLDTDEQYFSLNYFIQLAINGDTATIDMLHAPQNWEDVTTPIWEDLKSKRHLFYSKNAKSYIGYAKMQAAKYSLKGSRLDTAKKILDWCNNIINKNECSNAKGHYIYEYFKQEDFSNLEYLKINLIYDENNNIDVKKSFLIIFEKCYYFNSYIEVIYNNISAYHKQFGERAEAAMLNQNIDWKAVSHAFRASMQLKEICETGTLKYPLESAEFIKGIKYGKYHYINDDIGIKLDNLVDEVKSLLANSSFNDTPDIDFWNHWLLNVIDNNI